MARRMVTGFGEMAKQFEELNQRLEKVDYDEFCKSCAKELAARLLAKVIKRTQPGIYPPSTGKKGGTLRRGWSALLSEGFEITKSGNAYEIELINPVHYASYVEFGHRTRGGDGWVEGKFYLTISEKELERQAPRIIEKKMEAWLKAIFN